MRSKRQRKSLRRRRARKTRRGGQRDANFVFNVANYAQKAGCPH